MTHSIPCPAHGHLVTPSAACPTCVAIAHAGGGTRQRGAWLAPPGVTLHALKVWPEYFRALADGTKTFEVRKDDRGFRVGDVLDLHEFDPTRGEYTGQLVSRVVTYVMASAHHDGITPGHVVLGLRA